MPTPGKADTQTPEFFTIAPGNIRDLEVCLERVIQNGEARCALLIDKTGAIISRSGDFDTATPEVTAAVTAGAFAALQSLTRATESDELSIKFHGKKARKLYISRVAARVNLTVMYDERSNAGKVRAAARAESQKMGEILAKQPDTETGVQSFAFIQEKISEIFKGR